MNNYDKTATDFLINTGVEMTTEFLRNDYHFDSDASKRDIYKITFKRGNRKFSLDFGQSLQNSTKLKDPITGNEYTMSGASLKGGMKILDVEKYRGAVKPMEIKGNAPTAYDVLACLTKYDVGTFEDFCGEFGYDTDSRSAKKTYKAVLKEYGNVCKIWSDSEIELMQEIN